MKILALDSTSGTATAALTEDEKLIGLTVLDTKNTHSVTLLPTVDGLLENSGLKIKDVELFVCSAGPGSFTGVRIGAATVKGLAFAENKPCIGVSSLEALALNLCCEDGVICPVMDARRGQLYNALFTFENGGLKRLTEDRIITADELRNELCGRGVRVRLTGDGYKIAKTALSDVDCPETPELQRYHNAYNVAVLGHRRYISASEEERTGFTPSALSPVYLRASQAERERLEREAQNNIRHNTERK